MSKRNYIVLWHLLDLLVANVKCSCLAVLLVFYLSIQLNVLKLALCWPGMGSRQFCRGREVEAIGKAAMFLTKAEAESSRPRRGRQNSRQGRGEAERNRCCLCHFDIMHNAHVVSYVFLLCGQWHLSMKNTTEKFHNKYNTHCYCVVTVICTNIIFCEIPEEAETLRITLPLGHLLKNWTNFWCI